MTTDVPPISVLLPVYNAERYLGAAVESVLAQTFADFELLALDDGSSDRSLAILRDYAVRDRRVRVFTRENRGLVATLNELIAAARGRYLARMDADDICRPARFEKQLAYLESHPECVAVGSRVLFIDSSGMPIAEALDELTHEEIDGAHISGLSRSRMCHPSVMMRKDAVLRAGLYRKQFELAEDKDLFLRLAELGRLANLPEVLLDYRQHPKSICHSAGSPQWRASREAVRAAWARRGIAADDGRPELAWEPVTRADVHRIWAWWALAAGNVPTARKHAFIALTMNPFRLDTLRAAACALRGR